MKNPVCDESGCARQMEEESPGGRPVRPSHPPDTHRHLRAGARPSKQTLSPSRVVSSPPVRVQRTATANPGDKVQPAMQALGSVSVAESGSDKTGKS